MRIVLLCETFSKKMGYLQRLLPKYLARLGPEVHVITMDLAPYYQLRDFAQTYGGFNSADELAPGNVETFEGYTLHVLAHRRTLGQMRMRGLGHKLRELRPDVVQTMANFGWLAMDAFALRLQLGFRLFTGNHYHASVFPLAQHHEPAFSPARLRCLLARTVPGRVIGWGTEKCYAIAEDCADLAVRFFGVPREKVEVCPLGVDTEIFHPATSTLDLAQRTALRHEFGVGENEILCAYSGRFTDDKNPLLLAAAVERLANQGFPFRGLFIGNGTQAQVIRSHTGCFLYPFVELDELAELYRACDVAVWPTQESLSMLDAAACGLAVVANHTMTAHERLEGNGLAYLLNDLDDLCRTLLRLCDPQLRGEMGRRGAEKMTRNFSWEAIARRRLCDYEHALRGKSRSAAAELISSGQ
jgi:glycosyltransferase involved in cell wall biosynthesis